MQKIFIYLIVIIVFFISSCSVVLAQDQYILIAKVVDAGEIKESEGLFYQHVRVEIVNGEYKGIMNELQIPFENGLERALGVGDRIKVQTVEINDEIYFQFYDFSRSRNYIWLILLFLVILTAFLGFRGIKTLIPSLCLILFLLIGLIPSIIVTYNPIFLSLIIIGTIASFTAWMRLKHKLLTIIVPFSVILCLFLGYLVFMGFANVSYIELFFGNITPITDSLNIKVIEVVYTSIVFIPAGGVINASIQVAKHLLDHFGKVEKNELSEMLKSGLKLSQKISAGELNNLIIMIIGSSLVGIFLIKESFEDLRFWDNGWISLQLIYLVSSGISILLITPITVFITAAILNLMKHIQKGKGGQRKLNIKNVVQKTRSFKYFK